MRWLDSITGSKNMSMSKPWKTVKDGEAWCAAVHGVARSWTQPRHWTITTTLQKEENPEGNRADSWEVIFRKLRVPHLLRACSFWESLRQDACFITSFGITKGTVRDHRCWPVMWVRTLSLSRIEWLSQSHMTANDSLKSNPLFSPSNVQTLSCAISEDHLHEN